MSETVLCDCCGEPVETDQDPVLCDSCAEGVLGLMGWIADEVSDE